MSRSKVASLGLFAALFVLLPAAGVAAPPAAARAARAAARCGPAAPAPAPPPPPPPGPQNPVSDAPSPIADPSPRSAPPDRDEDALFGAPVEQITMDERLDERDESLAIGGRFFLRSQLTFYEDTDAEEAPFASPNLVDLYLDARPSTRLRFFVRGRLDYDFTVGEDAEATVFGPAPERTRVRLDQLWLKFDLARSVFITIGQQRVKWGSARVWNPTDFLNQEHLQPLSIFDERLGVPLLKVHLPIESLGWNLYAFGIFDGADEPRDVGGALRAEIVLGTSELSLSAAARDGSPLRLGADLSAALWEIDLRLEFAATRGGSQRTWSGAFDPAAGKLPTAEDRSDDWLTQIAAGAEVGIVYTDEDTLYVAAEAFYNPNGLDDPDLYPWLAYQGDLVPFYAGRLYGALSLVLDRPGSWNDSTVILSSVGNLSDRSFIARADFQTLVLTHLRLYLYAAAHFGEYGELRYEADIPAIPAVSGLEKGLHVAAPMVDLGAWVSMDF